jgi:hypothetical protein
VVEHEQEHDYEHETKTGVSAPGYKDQDVRCLDIARRLQLQLIDLASAQFES